MAKVKVKGAIIASDLKWIYDWFGIECTCPKDVETQIEAANGEALEVEINSGGGDVFAGSEIYTSLKAYAGDVVVKIVGIAASAASVIAMAGKKVMMSPTGQIMIHNVWTSAQGDYHDMEHMAEVLKGASKSIANAYMLKTGMTQDALLRLMSKETWMTAQDAIEYKFADEIMFDEGLQLAASADMSGMLPKEVIEKMRNDKAAGKLGSLQNTQPTPIEEPRQVPVDLYTKLYENLERRAQIC